MPPLTTTTSMSTSNSPPSPQQPTVAVHPPPSRRLPPPCWTHDETVALIEAYREKWYSLRRGNLRATHWQEVADGVAARCSASPAKTSIQCRHKMEKLRKRYRAEIQRIGNTPNGNRYPSSWIHFKIMDSMELGLVVSDPSNMDEDEEDDTRGDEIEEELMLYPKGIKQAIALPLNRRYPGGPIGGGNNGNGVRIKIPKAVDMSSRLVDDLPPPMNPNYGYGAGKGARNGYGTEGVGSGMEFTQFSSRSGLKRKEDGDGNGNEGGVMDAMVGAILKLGDGFVKMERMKMDMARELESMRMKMEMKRTEMILESQQKLVDSFSKTMLEKNKKVKRMPTPES